jgi:hypothetical protein
MPQYCDTLLPLLIASMYQELSPRTYLQKGDLAEVAYNLPIDSAVPHDIREFSQTVMAICRYPLREAAVLQGLTTTSVV